MKKQELEKKNKKTFKEWKDFLADECFDLEKYKNGRYDRKMFNFLNSEIQK